MCAVLRLVTDIARAAERFLTVASTASTSFIGLRPVARSVWDTLYSAMYNGGPSALFRHAAYPESRMDSVDLDVLKTSLRWLDEGHQATLATIVRTWGSAPRPIGAMTVIRDDGMVTGSVSGGCVEDDMIDKVKARQIAANGPELVVYGVTREQAERFGLPCGGTLELVCERLGPRSGLKELVDAVARHDIVTRRLDLASGEVRVIPGRGADTMEFDGKVLTTV